jgi:hypothetical protein
MMDKKNSASPRSLFANKSKPTTPRTMETSSTQLKTSRFSREEEKMSDSSGDFSDDEQYNDICSSNGPKYDVRLNKDFDLRKIYEDTLLKILNEYSR